MYKELKLTEGMSNKEVMYIVASEWVDEICLEAVKDADEIMNNAILNSMIRQAAEHILIYQERRKKIALGQESPSCLSEFDRDDVKAYKTVLYDNIFRSYGANTHNV